MNKIRLILSKAPTGSWII